MTAMSSLHRAKAYRYYVCQFPRVGKEHGALTYRAGLVDEIVWGMLKKLLLDPEALREGLEAYKQKQEENAGPISMHLSAVNSLLIEKQAALQRLLDLYLSGEFHKDMLIDKKTELEKAIRELDRERAALLGRLQVQGITEEQEEQLYEFARRIAEGLEVAGADVRSRRAIIEAAGVEVTLYPDEGAKKVQFECKLGAGFSAVSPIALGELAV